MSSILTDEKHNLIHEQKKMLTMLNQKAMLAKQNYEKVIINLNQEIVINNKEKINKRRKLLAVWNDYDYISTLSDEDICSNVKLKNSVAGTLIERGLR
jgi:hypothetical protein